MIYVFENQFNSEFWEKYNEDTRVQISPDSTLHWISKYRCTARRMSGHIWLRKNSKRYKNFHLISGENNIEKICKYYNISNLSYQSFPFADGEELKREINNFSLKLTDSSEKTLVLIAIASPKQDMIAQSLMSREYQEDYDIACLGYALTDKFMEIPSSLTLIASKIHLEWLLHAMFNFPRFLEKIKVYFR